MLEEGHRTRCSLDHPSHKTAAFSEHVRGGRSPPTLPVMIRRTGSTMERSSTVPVATAGSSGVSAESTACRLLPAGWTETVAPCSWAVRYQHTLRAGRDNCSRTSTILDKAVNISSCRLTGLALHSQRKKLRGETRVTS